MTAQELEILEKRLDKSGALKLERKLKQHVKHFERSGLLVAMDLRLLQDGQAHLVRGHPNFGAYIEAETDGEISAENAKKLSRAGAVLLLLQTEGRLPSLETMSEASKLPIGITGARALAAILTKLGPGAMLATYDKALEINQLVSGNSVQVATQILMPAQDELPELDIALEMPEQESDEEEGNGREEREQPEWAHAILDKLYDLESAIRRERKDEISEIAEEIKRIASGEAETI